MKFIRKGGSPQELRQWRDGQPIGKDGKHINCRYHDMPPTVKKVVKESLLREQGYLCCYTGQVITDNSSHIEHFKPQTICTEEEDILYSNLLAAFPGGSTQSNYGAHAKADWYDEELLVSPLHGGCENRFRFTAFGKIAAATENDKSAIETIQRVRLDHDELNELRRQAIHKVLIELKPSQKQLELIRTRYCTVDSNGRLNSFCFVIQQVAGSLLAKSRKYSQIRKARNKSAKSKRRAK